MGFATGSVEAIYRQFAVSLGVSILFSAFLALSLTPALCATILKPVTAHHERRGFFAWFNRGFDPLTGRYVRWGGWLVKRGKRTMLVYGAIVGALASSSGALATAFVPDEDQGSFMTSFTLPADATAERTRKLAECYDAHVATRPDIASNLSVLGFGFLGSGANAAMSFTSLKDFDGRTGSTDAEVEAATPAMAEAIEGEVLVSKQPAIEELGTTSGFALRLVDRAGRDAAAPQAASEAPVALAATSARLRNVRVDGLPGGPTVQLEFDREKAGALGLSFSNITHTLGVAMRPIVMTSPAFTLGIVPLMIAKGPSSETQNALGTGLFGGMISAAVLAVLFVPVFFVLVTRLAGRRARDRSEPKSSPLKA